MKEELEEIIRLGDHGNYDNSDSEDEELTIARQESIRSKMEWEERQRRRARTGEDSVNELGGDSPFLQPVLQVAVEVGKSLRCPSAYEVTEVYLEEEFREIQEWVKEFKPIWEERGITRFDTNFIALESIVRSKQALKEMVTSEEWKRSKYARKIARLEIMEVINSTQFWKKAEREVATLDSEQNFSWLPKELLNERDEETQGEDMHNISPTPSNDESVQLLTSSGGNDDDGDGGGGDDLGGDNEGVEPPARQHFSAQFFGNYGKEETSHFSIRDYQTIKYCGARSKNYARIFKAKAQLHQPRDCLNHKEEPWKPLDEHWCKINSDGTRNTTTGEATCGGVIRDTTGA
ncbi:hypothetical protein F3Y22_tig00117034pilonHSYRG01653 [Hibiscus syriacus]|uniref:Uncharacterized protein n=1 Tax=Hibiscus syriacus TaxID=106335 RepID=A0A6A2XA47_HIBSY|nr:hypothetical protein F3Y22_tig00117034pilonHSYRG01653 [Hibiscus syriacus]